MLIVKNVTKSFFLCNHLSFNLFIPLAPIKHDHFTSQRLP